jgi:YfiH family protein
VAPEFVVPHWDAPANVRALQTTRAGGHSAGPWAGFNLGDHVGDDAGAVAANRALLRGRLPVEPAWLRQVHGAAVAEAAAASGTPEADASVARAPGAVCAILTADCLPVLFCDRAGSVVAAAHAGWRGLLGGVLENSVAALAVPPEQVIAWLGPAIGARSFEVGGEVRTAFAARDRQALEAFVPGAGDRWLCDIYALARQRLEKAGVFAISGGGECTVSAGERYFSYRRDGVTGRMATLIWMERTASGV